MSKNGIASQTLYNFNSCQLKCDSVGHITGNPQRHSHGEDANAHHMKYVFAAHLVLLFFSSLFASMLAVLIVGCLTQAHSTMASSAKAPVDCTSCVTPNRARPTEWTSELSSAQSTTANPSGGGTTNGSHTPKWKVREMFVP